MNVEDGTALVQPEVHGVEERASSARSGCRGNRFPKQIQVSLWSGRKITTSFAKLYGLLQLCNIINSLRCWGLDSLELHLGPTSVKCKDFQRFVYSFYSRLPSCSVCVESIIVLKLYLSGIIQMNLSKLPETCVW